MPHGATDVPAVPRRRGLTIADGCGGGLTLDLRHGDLLLLADACRRVVAGAVPEHAAAIKVRAAGTCYLIRRAAAADRAPSVVILDLFDPSARVELDTGVAEVVATLIEDGVTGKDA